MERAMAGHTKYACCLFYSKYLLIYCFQIPTDETIWWGGPPPHHVTILFQYDKEGFPFFATPKLHYRHDEEGEFLIAMSYFRHDKKGNFSSPCHIFDMTRRGDPFLSHWNSIIDITKRGNPSSPCHNLFFDTTRRENPSLLHWNSIINVTNSCSCQRQWEGWQLLKRTLMTSAASAAADTIKDDADRLPPPRNERQRAFCAWLRLCLSFQAPYFIFYLLYYIIYLI